MIKAPALTLISQKDTHSEEPFLSDNQTKLPDEIIKLKGEDIYLPIREQTEPIPESVSKLAIELMENAPVYYDLIQKIRAQYSANSDLLCMSLADKLPKEREMILSALDQLYGVVGSFYYNKDLCSVQGILSFTPKAKAFMYGKYLEIALQEEARSVINLLAKKYQTKAKVYANAVTVTENGNFKNEFDFLICFGERYFIVEIKSGKSFRDFQKYVEIGDTYDISPQQILLVDNCIRDDVVETIEYFCSYHVCNLQSATFRDKLTLMIENSIKNEKGE